MNNNQLTNKEILYLVNLPNDQDIETYPSLYSHNNLEEKNIFERNTDPGNSLSRQGSIEDPGWNTLAEPSQSHSSPNRHASSLLTVASTIAVLLIIVWDN